MHSDTGGDTYSTSVRLYCPNEFMELLLVITSILCLIVTVVSLIVCCRGDEEAADRVKLIDAIAHFACAVVLIIGTFLFMISAVLLVVNCNTQSNQFTMHALEQMGIGANPLNRHHPEHVKSFLEDEDMPVFPDELELNTTETTADRTICVFMWQLSDKFIISWNGMLCAVYYAVIGWVLWRTRNPSMGVIKPNKEIMEAEKTEEVLTSNPQSDTNTIPETES